MKALRVAPWLAALTLWLASCVPPSTESTQPPEPREQAVAARRETPQPQEATPEAPGPKESQKPQKPAPKPGQDETAKAKPQAEAAAKPQPRPALAAREKQPVARPPQKPKQPTPRKPAEKAQPPTEPEAPKPTPPRPPKVFLFSPQHRTGFAPGEVAQVTVVVCAPSPLADAKLSLAVSGGGRLSWTAADSLGRLASGRHSFTYGISTEDFPPGDYTLTARLGGVDAGKWGFRVGPGVPRTHLPIAGWLDEAPKSAVEARRLSEALGFNTMVLSRRSAWRAAGVNVMDADLLARIGHLLSHPEAPPLETSLDAPPFVRCGDLLSGAGLRWVSGCAVSGGSFPHFLPSSDYAEPKAVEVGVERLSHRLAAERRFRNCMGVHLSDEVGLAPWSTGDSSGPFGAPWRLAAFKSAAGVESVPWRKGAQEWETWERFLRFRVGLLGACLRTWVGAARAARPDALVVGELGSPVALARGVYPPAVTSALPVVLARARLDGPAGMMMPALVADLARAGGGEKAVWLMPEVARDAEPDELRAALSLALARKIDGVVLPAHLDYLFNRPDDDPLTTDLVVGASGLNHTLTRLGDFLLALHQPRDAVGVFYSATEHMARCGKDPLKNPEGLSYPWTVAGAYVACMFAHFPGRLVTEEDVLAGRTKGVKVILVAGVSRMAPAVKAALEAFMASGGAVLLDAATGVELKGARRLKFSFPDLRAYHAEIDRKARGAEVDATMEHRDAVVWQKLIYPLLTKLMVAFKQVIERDYTATDPDVVVCGQECGAGRYVFVVNNTQRTDLFRGLRQELAAAKTSIILREGDYAVYDVMAGRRLYPGHRRGHPRLDRILPPGGLDILALLPEPIGGVSLERARWSGGYVELHATVRGKERRGGLLSLLRGAKAKPIDAAVPLRVVVRGPDGRKRLDVYRAYRPGGYEERLRLGRFVPRGRWTVEVTELLSGLSAKSDFRVSPSPDGWVRRLGGSLVFDAERIRTVLRQGAPLWIVVGTKEEAARAEKLAAMLRSEQRPVEVKLAKDIPQPRKAKGSLSVAPDGTPLPSIPNPAVLVGDITTHEPLQALHDAGVLPVGLTPDYPGPGRAVACAVPSAFRPGADVAVAAGVGPGSVEAAFRLLEKAAASSRIATRWVGLPAASAQSPPPQPQRQVARLSPRWENQWSDQAVSAATSPQSTEFTVGYFDGDVHAYDRTGKTLWTRRMPTRVRAVARSLDGAWVGVASYPGLLLLTSQGRPQWAATLDDTSRRADFTALAIAPDGALTVAGTRRGVVFGYDVSGSKVFSIGEADADENTEGWQSRFGTITAIALSPKTGTVVIGAQLGVVAVDPAGQELWTSKKLKGITSLTWSLGDTQTVALGARDGTVACVGSGGSVLWQTKAPGCIASVSFLGTSQKVLAASLGGSLRCYDRNGKLLWERNSPVGFCFVGSSADGEVVAAADLGGRVVVCDDTGTLLAETERVEGVPRACVLSRSGEWILVGTSSGKVAFFHYKRPKVGEDEL